MIGQYFKSQHIYKPLCVLKATYYLDTRNYIQIMNAQRMTRGLLYLAHVSENNYIRLAVGSFRREKPVHMAKFLKSKQYFELKFKNV